MSEPDVASSDPTSLQTTVRREGAGAAALRATPWCSTAASGSSPARRTQCQLLIVLCRNADADDDCRSDSRSAKHGAEPDGTPGGGGAQHPCAAPPMRPKALRNSPAHAHCPPLRLLGDWGKALPWRRRAWARTDCTTALRTIGQMQLALCNWRQNARWNLHITANCPCLNKPAMQNWLADFTHPDRPGALAGAARRLAAEPGDAFGQAGARASGCAIKVVAARQRRVNE